MGNCLKLQNEDQFDDTGSIGDLNVQDTWHKNIMRTIRGQDVFLKYSQISVLGKGSMGHVVKVEKRHSKRGGFAFHQEHNRHNQNKSKTRFNSFSELIMTRRLSSRDNNNKDIKDDSKKDEHVAVDKIRKAEVYYALKSIILDRVSPVMMEELRNEIDILKGMDHPNIIKAHEVYEYDKQMYIVLELCDGGDLYTRSPYTEQESAQIIRKLLSAVKYMHDHGIVHRDLKLENIMFESKAPNAEIKVIDFGLSHKFISNEKKSMSQLAGTIYTMAPQVIQGNYSAQADLWSVGVITYMLLCSRRPFHHRKREVTIDKIMAGDYGKLEGGPWRIISSEAKDLVKGLLVVDPAERLTATEALEHSWLADNFFELTDTKFSDKEVKEAVGASLQNYKNELELKKIALNLIAYNSTSTEIMELRNMFNRYDTSSDGIITFEEFKAALAEANYSESALQAMFESVDVDKDGEVEYTEFIAATLEARGNIEEERIAEAFDRLDIDHSGAISKLELAQFMGTAATSKEVDEILAAADTNNDGQLSYSEFVELFRKRHNEYRETLRTALQNSTEATSDRPEGVPANS